jgi:hypothetical protein
MSSHLSSCPLFPSVALSLLSAPKELVTVPDCFQMETCFIDEYGCHDRCMHGVIYRHVLIEQVPPEDGHRIQSPKRRVLYKRPDDG